MAEHARTVAVIGAGIVGVSTAIWLHRAGHRVILIDRAAPGTDAATSYGNAGILASAAIVPVTVPGLLRKAPGMLLGPDRPLFLRWGYVPRLIPWLIRFLAHANAADTRRIAGALAPIVGDSLADHQALAAGTGAEKWIKPSDYLFLYAGKADYKADAFGWDLRRAHGCSWVEMAAKDIRAFDPALASDMCFGARLADHGHITDPGCYVAALAAHVVRQGARQITGKVDDFAFDKGKITGVRVGGETISCDAAVLATGAWSRNLCAKLGLNIPLESERGYHIEFTEPSIAPRVPTMLAAGKCVLTPMAGRLRVAGLVEFGGLEAAPSRAPFRVLRQRALAALPGLRWREEVEWMGHRPSLTDSIPLIGEVPGRGGTFLGFGHQHVGLTGGPKTGRLLAQIIDGQRPNIDMQPYSPARFAG